MVVSRRLIPATPVSFPHFAKRIDAFLNPEGGNTYQVDKALNSLLEGGWFGRGPGESLAKKVIPDAHADYVFSAAAGSSQCVEFGRKPLERWNANCHEPKLK